MTSDLEAVKKTSKYQAKTNKADEFLAKREATLLAILQKSFRERVIIFCNHKTTCTRLAILMTMHGLKVAEVHSNISQTARIASIEQFQSGEVDYLIGTDVVARGLDISNVKCVINFSFPSEPKRYLHRIGRTARAGQSGVAITLCNEEERKDLKKLSRKLSHNLNTFSINAKAVEPHFQRVIDLDKTVKAVMCEIEQEKEAAEALREIERNENIEKYKSEIMNRPKRDWFVGKKRRETVQKDSKTDLQNIKATFEKQLDESSKSNFKRKRTNKAAKKIAA